MGFWIYRKIRKLLQTKPVQLWGISLLAGLLVWLAAIGFWAIPAVAWFLDLVFSGSMALIFLRAYQGAAPAVGDLFSPFRREQLPHVVGGMAWMSLWVFLWSLIPVAGLILGPVKLYTYRFAPYILMTRPDVKATDAIRISAQETRGYRGKMFLADLLIYGSWSLLLLVLLGLAQIPFLRVPCYALLILATLLGAALTPGAALPGGSRLQRPIRASCTPRLHPTSRRSAAPRLSRRQRTVLPHLRSSSAQIRPVLQ